MHDRRHGQQKGMGHEKWSKRKPICILTPIGQGPLIAASSAEDITVVGVVSLAAFHPEAALIIAGILLFLGLMGVYFAFRFIRRGYLRFKAWREKRRELATGSSAV